MSKNTIEKIKEHIAYEDPENNPWVKLYFDTVRFPDGKEGYYNRIVENGGKSGVGILPVFNFHIGLVRQYRYPIGCEMWEIARGFGETNNPREDAARELAEECGVKVAPSNLLELGPVYPNSGLLASVVYLFCVKISDKEPVHKTQDEEVVEFKWFSMEEVISLVKGGELADSFTLSALFRAACLGILKIC